MRSSSFLPMMIPPPPSSSSLLAADDLDDDDGGRRASAAPMPIPQPPPTPPGATKAALAHSGGAKARNAASLVGDVDVVDGDDGEEDVIIERDRFPFLDLFETGAIACLRSFNDGL